MKNFDINEYKAVCERESQIVTVFLTSNNRAKYVGEAIGSILKQDYPNFCLIILDNFSTDGTVEIINGFADNRLFLLERESTELFHNFKYAFSICMTRYMVVFHDDDIVDCDYLSTVLREMENNDYKMLSPSSVAIDEEGNVISGFKPHKKQVFSKDDYLRKLLCKKEYLGMCYPAVIYRTEFYRNIDDFVNWQEAGPASDQLIYLQTERYGGKICALGEKRINYRIHHQQGSQGNHGIMEIKLFNYLIKNAYYRQKMYKYKEEVFHYLLYCYKAMIRNYIDNNNLDSVQSGLQLDNKYLIDYGWKVSAMKILYKISYLCPGCTIIPAAKILRYRILHRREKG